MLVSLAGVSSMITPPVCSGHRFSNDIIVYPARPAAGKPAAAWPDGPLRVRLAASQTACMADSSLMELVKHF
jgi:hypothetical protein